MKMKTLSVLFVFFSIIGIIAYNFHAEAQKAGDGALKGQVADASGQAIAKASVYLIPASDVEAMAKTIKESSRIVAADVIKIPVKSEEAKKAHGTGWITYLLLFSLVIVFYFVTRKSKKFLRARDISLILKDEVSAGGILEAIRKEGKPLLRDAKVADYYKGKQIPSGFKGLTISCLYRSDERTLTETEINPVHSLICALLADRFQAQIR